LGLEKHIDISLLQPPPPGQKKDRKQKASLFFVAWVATKLTEPLRLMITLFITPRLSRYLRPALYAPTSGAPPQKAAMSVLAFALMAPSALGMSSFPLSEFSVANNSFASKSMALSACGSASSAHDWSQPRALSPLQYRPYLNVHAQRSLGLKP
jgi:hypothetical protein